MTHLQTAPRRRAATALLAALLVAAFAAVALSAVYCRADLLGGGGADRHQPIPESLEDVRERVRHASEELAAAQAKLEGNRESRLSSIAEGLRDRVAGWVYDSHDSPSRASQAYESVKSTVKDVFTPEKYQQAMHRLKMSLGVESPTTYEKIRAAFGGDKYESIPDQLRHAFGAEPATELGFWSRIKQAIGGDESVLTKLKHVVGLETTPLASDWMHRVKVAVGAEDPTTWEKIRGAIEPERGIVGRLLHPFADTSLTAENVYVKIKNALQDLDPRRQETTMDRVRIALGLKEPSYLEQLKNRYAPAAHEAVESTAHVTGELAGHAYEKASEMLSAANVDDIAHKIKVAIGTEDPTTYEKIRNAIYPEPTIADKVRDYFGRHGLTREQLMERASATLADLDPARRETIGTKLKHAIGLEKPSLLDRIRGGIASKGESAVETTKELLSGETFDAALHKIKVAVGAEDPTIWESIKSAVTPQWSVGDRVRNWFGRDMGVSPQELYDRIQTQLPAIVPERRQSILHKIGVILGVSEPTLGDKWRGLKDRITGTAAEAGEKAEELLSGSTYDEAVHKIKMALGAEDPTVWERVQSALSPREGVSDKIRHVLGRDKGISRDDIVERVKAGLATIDPTRRTNLVTKVKEALGMQEQRSLLGRVADRIGEALTPKTRETSIDQALQQFRASVPENRDEAYKQLQHALQSAKINMESKATSLFEMLGSGKAEPSTIAKMRQEFSDKVSHLYDSMQSSMDHLKSEVGNVLKRGSRKQYLLESSKEDEGISSHYVNDNGQETLDITGDKAIGVDTLKVLNSFRKDFALEAHSSMPESATVQTHSVKRPHVLIKSMRMVEGDRFDYCYDDGQETLSVEWRDRLDHDKTLDADTQQRLLQEFRSSHGLSNVGSTSHSVKVRGHVVHKQDL